MVFTTPKDIFANAEPGDIVHYYYKYGKYKTSRPKTGMILKIIECDVCTDNICRKKLIIENNHDSGCFRYGPGRVGNIWAVLSLIKKEAFITEEDFML